MRRFVEIVQDPRCVLKERGERDRFVKDFNIEGSVGLSVSRLDGLECSTVYSLEDREHYFLIEGEAESLMKTLRSFGVPPGFDEERMTTYLMIQNLMSGFRRQKGSINGFYLLSSLNTEDFDNVFPYFGRLLQRYREIDTDPSEVKAGYEKLFKALSGSNSNET